MEKRTKILFANSDAVTLDFFEVMLSKLGFDLLSVETGDQIFDVLESENPDILILDADLAGISGWDIVKQLKNSGKWQAYRELPVIFFSDSTAVKDRIAAFELGVEEYIMKPYNFTELLARIRSIVRHQDLSSRVMDREKKLAGLNSLRQSFTYFTDHLKEPLIKLRSEAEKLDADQIDQVESFIKDFKDHSDQTLAALEALEEELEELATAGAFEAGESSLLNDLEEKFLRHFTLLKESGTVNG